MRRPLLLAAATLLTALPFHADDGAASIAAGGLVLMKHEPRITMAKEVLQISLGKVLVDYDFRSDSDVPITTVVAFPVPAYTFGESNETFGDPAFSDFQLAINGNVAVFFTEARALLGKRDITDLLKLNHIDAATFGHWNAKQHDHDTIPDFQRASPEAQARLTAAGAFKDGEPLWSVSKKYYWTQTFPPHTTIHIRHQYTPAVGGSNTIGDVKTFNPKREEYAELASLCPTKALLDTLSRQQRLDPESGDNLSLNYVDFILTTANTWKTPIEDFTLIVERPEDTPNGHHLVSFCWNGPTPKKDAHLFTAHQLNLVPAKELRIGYIFSNHRKSE